jgi:hypothetical protein
LNRWHGVEQSDRGLRIMDVGRRRDNHQRYAPRVSQDVTFAAFFRSIRGVRSGVRPPKTARTLALSMMPKDASSCPRCPSTRSSLRWIRGHTPTCVQSRNRRQQVTPEPQPSSAGTSRQGMPVRNTYTMPVKQARSGTRGRPPLGLAGSGGKSGLISVHNLSGTNVNAMVSPPCYPRHLNYRQNHEF